MNALRLIVTHPGGAHKDEFLACCLLVAENTCAIERRDPTAADLGDPAVGVVDVGGCHQPALSNFDHHQFPAGQTPVCALSLVLQAMDLYEDGRRHCDWLEVAEWFDCLGPGETAQRLRVSREVLSQLNSPIDITLLRRFAGSAFHRPGEPLWEVMRMVGEDLRQFLLQIRQHTATLQEKSELWNLALPDREAKVLFIPREDETEGDFIHAVRTYLETEGLEDQVVALVYPDQRGPGYGLSRLNDQGTIDFNRIADLPDVHFAHKRGFVAKTRSRERTRLRELLEAAIRA